jgi:DNA-binding transcriptional LysR family regulator
VKSIIRINSSKNQMNISSRQLDAFIALAQLGSFTLAAIRADTEELQAEWFCADRLHLVCRADHALAALPSPRMADLKDQPFIQLARHSSVRQYLESQSRAQPLDTLLEVEHLATVMGMVRAGLGISVVPALALFHFVQPGLVTRPLADADRQRDLYLVRRRQRSLSPAAQAFHTLALEHRPGTDEAA